MHFQTRYILLTFVARWRHNFFQNCVQNFAKSPKFGGKVCAHHFVQIAEGFERKLPQQFRAEHVDVHLYSDGEIGSALRRHVIMPPLAGGIKR